LQRQEHADRDGQNHANGLDFVQAVALLNDEDIATLREHLFVLGVGAVSYTHLSCENTKSFKIFLNHFKIILKSF
ncbi:hypothetical protein, partial [Treponema sp. R8-4-B8]